jgi:hypothetical protein
MRGGTGDLDHVNRPIWLDSWQEWLAIACTLTLLLGLLLPIAYPRIA